MVVHRFGHESEDLPVINQVGQQGAGCLGMTFLDEARFPPRSTFNAKDSPTRFRNACSAVSLVASKVVTFSLDGSRMVQRHHSATFLWFEAVRNARHESPVQVGDGAPHPEGCESHTA